MCQTLAFDQGLIFMVLKIIIFSLKINEYFIFLIENYDVICISMVYNYKGQE